MVELLTNEELATMHKAGIVAARIVKELKRFIRAGITTKDIEQLFEERLKSYPSMSSAFRGFRGYPASICVSLNAEVIHGLPSERVIRGGDIVSVDMGIRYNGLFVDCASTYPVGYISRLARKLLWVTRKALYEGIRQARIGRTTGDIGSAIQWFVEKRGFSVIRKFVGHGIGRGLHVFPEIPNFGCAGGGTTLKEGMAIAIEPMVSSGSFEIDILDDGWTAKTHDNSLAAHFEHTVAITKRGPWILTR